MNKKLNNLRSSIMSAFPELICNTKVQPDSTQGKVNKLLLDYFIQLELIRMNDSSPQPVQAFNENQVDSNNFTISKT